MLLLDNFNQEIRKFYPVTVIFEFDSANRERKENFLGLTFVMRINSGLFQFEFVKHSENIKSNIGIGKWSPIDGHYYQI